MQLPGQHIVGEQPFQIIVRDHQNRAGELCFPKDLHHPAHDLLATLFPVKENSFAIQLRDGCGALEGLDLQRNGLNAIDQTSDHAGVAHQPFFQIVCQGLNGHGRAERGFAQHFRQGVTLILRCDALGKEACHPFDVFALPGKAAFSAAHQANKGPVHGKRRGQFLVGGLRNIHQEIQLVEILHIHPSLL